MKPFAHTAAVVGSRFLLLVFLLLVALAQSSRAQTPGIPQQGCGNENETPCPPEIVTVPLGPLGPAEVPINSFCDTGLQLVAGICTNSTRRQPEVDPFVGGWADWALKNQRELAQDEPLNWVTQIATHNSYNTFADGHALIDFPNQIYSTTDQLRLGARAITFDNYFLGGALPGLDANNHPIVVPIPFFGARLCHSAFSASNPHNLADVAALCEVQVHNSFYSGLPSMRYYSNGIKEIRNWLDQNPNEIVIVDFEEYVPQMGAPTDVDEFVLAPIRAYLGDMVFTPPPPVLPASVTGSITDSVLTVTAVSSGALHVDEQITGTGIPPGTFIQSFGKVNADGTGTYNLNKTSVTGSIAFGHLTVTALGNGATRGALYIGDQITGTGIPPGTFIQSFGTHFLGLPFLPCLPDNSGSSGPFGVVASNTGFLGCYGLSQTSLTGVPTETITTTLTVPSETIQTNPILSGRFPDRWPTRREMLAAGKRVIILDNAYDQFVFAKLTLPSEFLFSERETVAGSYGDDAGTWLALNQRRYDRNNPRACFEDVPHLQLTDFDVDFHKALFTKGTIIVEERELGEFVGFSARSIDPLLPQAAFGLMSDGDIVDATACNYSIITLDKYSQELVPPDGSLPPPQPPLNLPNLDYLKYTLKPDFHRQALAVWSWNVDDRGQNGDCAMLRGFSLLPILPPFRKWASADCNNSQVQAKFACARPRSQSGKDPLQWEDPLGDDWRVTSVAGSWDHGPSECQKEFGSDFVFSVPVSGYQNERLKDADPTTFDPLFGTFKTDNIWLNYRQHNLDDKWVIPRPPVAKAGPNQVVECGNSVKLDAGGSFSPDGLTLSYKWLGPFGIRTSQVVNLATPRDLPLGVDPIGLTVTDSDGQTATDSLTVTVKDTTPPVIRSAVANPNSSWPPNHTMFPVLLSVDASDTCDPNVQCRVVTVTSNEGTSADWQIVGPLEVMLRSERSGNGDGRVYTIWIQCTDASGNSSTRAVTVTIAHDQGKSKP